MESSGDGPEATFRIAVPTPSCPRDPRDACLLRPSLGRNTWTRPCWMVLVCVGAVDCHRPPIIPRQGPVVLASAPKFEAPAPPDVCDAKHPTLCWKQGLSLPPMSDEAILAFDMGCREGDTEGCHYRNVSRWGYRSCSSCRSMTELDMGRKVLRGFNGEDRDVARELCGRGWANVCWEIFAESERFSTIGSWFESKLDPRILTVVSETPLEIVSSEPTLEATAYRGAKVLVMNVENGLARVVLTTVGRAHASNPAPSLDATNQLAPPLVATMPAELLSVDELHLEVPPRAGRMARDVSRGLSAYPRGPVLGTTLCGELRVLDKVSAADSNAQQLSQTIDGIEIRGWTTDPVTHTWEENTCRPFLPHWECGGDGMCQAIDWKTRPLPTGVQRFTIDTRSRSQQLLEFDHSFYLVTLTKDAIGTRCLRYTMIRSRLISDSFEVVEPTGKVTLQEEHEPWLVDVTRFRAPIAIPDDPSPSWGSNLIGPPGASEIPIRGWVSNQEASHPSFRRPRFGFVIVKVTPTAIVLAEDAIPVDGETYDELLYRPSDALVLYRNRGACEAARARRPRPRLPDAKARNQQGS